MSRENNVELKRKCLRLLLSAGADPHVRDCDGHTPYDIDPQNVGVICNTLNNERLCKAIALKNVSKPSIELRDESIIEKCPSLLDYYQDCIEHITKAKFTKITDSCTFLELLTKPQCQIAALMRNPQFQSNFRLYDLKVFSMYSEDIFEAFERAELYYHSMLEHKDLINEALYNTLPHLIVTKVICYVLGCKMQKN